ncbi:hypothetical protein [Rhodovulum sp. ES.010]|uniref:hypothetical protein n=1 Tax=Rhodovulum sp. ES.010 TaxID=1882821 RepID=UPI00158810F8|nr:hypothetical protein [Rhodovulum sp. ES.010]
MTRAAALGLCLAAPAAGSEAGFEPAPVLNELSDVTWPARAGADGPGAETLRLKAGLLCVAWARDMIGQHWRVLDALEGPATWSHARQLLWQQVGWVDAFERRQLRPVIDEDSQRALLRVWWPEGISTEAGSAAAAEMHRFCLRLPGLLGTVDPDGPLGL